MNHRLGRNDPCHCGSGKKYKRCHLAEDERARALELQREREAAVQFGAEAESATQADFSNEVELKPFARSEGEGSSIEPEAVKRFAQNGGRIAAASAEVSAHLDEFCRLQEDPEEFGRGALRLFQEEIFAHLRFTADDVQRAFEKVGFPVNGPQDDKAAKIFRKAILFLATQEVRMRYAMELMMIMADLVEAGRFIDACYVQIVTVQLTEEPRESNVFLFAMFLSGVMDWESERDSTNEEMLRELGIDLPTLEAMNGEQLQDWLEGLSADPKARALMERLLDEHPEQRQLSEAQLRNADSESGNLLQRPDASHLLIPEKEILPWAEKLAKSFRAGAEELGVDYSATTKRLKKKTASALLSGHIAPVLKEAAKGIFTAERLKRLREELEQYSTRLYDAGEKRAAFLAMNAAMRLEQETEPENNGFLLMLCYASIMGCAAPSDL